MIMVLCCTCRDGNRSGNTSGSGSGAKHLTCTSCSRLNLYKTSISVCQKFLEEAIVEYLSSDTVMPNMESTPNMRKPLIEVQKGCTTRI